MTEATNVTGLRRLSVWFRQLPASMPPTKPTANGARMEVIEGAIERLEDAQMFAIDELRDAIVGFRTALHAERTPRQSDATLVRAWTVYRATRTLRNVELALRRLRRERDLSIRVPGDERTTLRSVPAVAAA